MGMSISGFTGGMQAYPVQESQKQQVAQQAPKTENDDVKSKLLDTEGQKERFEKMEAEAAKRVQEQTKEEMNLSERSASAMGFGSKLQMELMGTA